MNKRVYNLNKERIIKNLLEELNKYYPPGLYEWTYEYRRSEYNNLIEIEREIDSAFLNGSDKELKKVLVEYWKFHKRNIDDFNNRSSKNIGLGNQKLNYEQVRKERLEERLNTKY